MGKNAVSLTVYLIENMKSLSYDSYVRQEGGTLS